MQPPRPSNATTVERSSGVQVDAQPIGSKAAWSSVHVVGMSHMSVFTHSGGGVCGFGEGDASGEGTKPRKPEDGLAPPLHCSSNTLYAA